MERGRPGHLCCERVTPVLERFARAEDQRRAGTEQRAGFVQGEAEGDRACR